MLKKILLAVLGLAILLIAFVAIAAFVTESDYSVERQVTVNRPKADVFNYIKLLKNQNEWGPWAKKDPGIKLDYRGTDGTVGFVSSWDGNDEVGAGEQEIRKIVEGERVDTQLRFKRPFESTSDAYMITEAAGEGQTRVRWGFSGSMPKPMNLMLLVVDMDKAVGKDFDEGLAGLKTILEKK